MKRKEEMKTLYDAICRGDPSVSSSALSSSLGVTPQALSLRIFRDAYRLSGCCLPSFASELEVFQHNDFFTLCLRLPDVCDAADRRAPLTSSENSAVVKTVSRHLALLKPALEDLMRVLSGVSAGVSGGVLAGAGLKRQVEAVQSAVGKKEGRRALFRMARLLVELVLLQLRKTKWNGWSVLGCCCGNGK
ncbi:uncharacterized protein MONOS_11061 [Monocercomonoides exilis]|uniref:uncharacterized protein n=1 Tax=Monocercomonoides exilis TaxID=2049356 RepID=UPI003559E97C|nr:hypothetical protein MONOS_11061 [Monocercomonoides exilis]|eukprot:MONOS_11061.1-p1 / transcript=MONOS_11061.1 / gene=MONOS_11061 / organism=Monocercomonoides_exilis_PA203 / gene_product=unspecified product / transcript_product=unspecified product / location=Mono_scaffold00533:40796-41425(+) / protein_length=190 / sequence_SO=supercontig / SO=protein_coding / is_pseudo=false